MEPSAKESDDFAVEDEADYDSCGDTSNDDDESTASIDDMTMTSSAQPPATSAMTFSTTAGKPIDVYRCTEGPVTTTTNPTVTDYFPVKDTTGNVYRAYKQNETGNCVVLSTQADDLAVVSEFSTQIKYTRQLANVSLDYNQRLLSAKPPPTIVSKLWKQIFKQGILLSTVHANFIIEQRNSETKKRRREKTREQRQGNGNSKRPKGEPIAAPANPPPCTTTVTPTINVATTSKPSMQFTVTGLSVDQVNKLATFVASL